MSRLLTGRSTALAGCLVLLLVPAGCTSTVGSPAVAPGTASRGGLAGLEVLTLSPASLGALPPGWEPYQFEKVPRSTSYRVESLDGGLALCAASENAASALRTRVDVDPAKLPRLAWAWRVDGSLEGASLQKKDGDDCAARVLLLFRYEASRASFLERAQFESAHALHGEYPPQSMLVYAWTGALEPPTAQTSPFSDRVKVIAVQRGNGAAGRWVEEVRNYLEDYRSAFGAEPTALEAIAVMVDTDNTGSRAHAAFRGLRFLPLP